MLEMTAVMPFSSETFLAENFPVTFLLPLEKSR